MINMSVLNIMPKMIIKIKKENDKLFNIEMSVNDDLSHIAIIELRDFLKDTNRFRGTSHKVKIFNMEGKKVDQTTLYII
jgi:hypothetical protein